MWERAWLLTWTTYGTWLPGDSRGFVGFHPNSEGQRIIHNEPGTEYDRDMRWLHKYSKRMQSEETVWLTREQAEVCAMQFRETAAYRGWLLPAFAIMANHAHLVVQVTGDPEPETLLHSFKSYASRQLNDRFGKRTWWTASGSTRKLPDEPAVRAASRYVRDQERPLVVEVDSAWCS